MRLSKRQLKQIIREEYSRLKRRGLIRESVNQALVDEMRLALDDIMADADMAMGAYDMDGGEFPEYAEDVEDESYIRAELQAMFPEATPAEIQEAMDSF